MIESEEEERKAAASRIVHNLKDGVDALTEILDNYENSNHSPLSLVNNDNFILPPKDVDNSIVALEDIQTPAILPNDINMPTVSPKEINTSTSSLRDDDNFEREKVSKSEISDFIVTESQIVSTAEDITEKQMREPISESTVIMEESTSSTIDYIDTEEVVWRAVAGEKRLVFY